MSYIKGQGVEELNRDNEGAYIMMYQKVQDVVEMMEDLHRMKLLLVQDTRFVQTEEVLVSLDD